jgi:hypothetical protein
MAEYKIFKETTLPGTLQPHSIYLVAPAARPNYVEMYVTGADASVIKRNINQSDIQTMIDLAVSQLATIEIVADIAARDALGPEINTQVLVIDAKADPDVELGAATYVWYESDSRWVKISEHESMDVTVNWGDIQGRPTSSVIDIDDAVSRKHSHTNKTELDKVGEDVNGNMDYNGQPLVIAWDSVAW